MVCDCTLSCHIVIMVDLTSYPENKILHLHKQLLLQNTL